jgi:hypothetical protein
VRTLEDYIGQVKVRQAEIASSLAAGNAVNFETYQRMVGHYTGLQEALDILNNLLREDNE